MQKGLPNGSLPMDRGHHPANEHSRQRDGLAAGAPLGGPKKNEE
jgi:hypothetical protein